MLTIYTLASSNGSFAPTAFTSTNTTLLGDFSVITSSGDIDIDNGVFTGNNTFTAAGGLDVDGTCSFSTTSGTTTFTRNGGESDQVWNGTFNIGNWSVTNNDNQYILIGNTAGSVFTITGTSTFNVTNSGRLYMAHLGTASFGNTITANCSSTGGFEIGGGGGVSTQSAGNFTTSGFTLGSLILNRLTQSLASSNGSFAPTAFTSTNTTLLGDFSVISSGDIDIDNGVFTGNNTFTAAGLDVDGTCSFSTTSGTTTFTRNGGALNHDWNGTFNIGNWSVTNNGNQNILIGNTAGSVFTITGTSTFNVTNSGRLYMAHLGTASFGNTITFNCSGSGGGEIGGGGGVSTQSAGNFTTSGFTLGSLILNRLTQSVASSNGSFAPTAFTSTNTTLLGDFSVITSSGDIDIDNGVFTGNNTFTAAGGLDVDGTCSFSTTSGTTTFTRNGGGSDLIWSGGNTFGNVVVINNDNQYILMAQTNPDDYNASATFRQLLTGGLYPAFNGNNTFSGDISTTGSTAAITFGLGTGRMIIDGSSTQTFSGSAALLPIVRRITMSTSGTGNLTLAVPVNISVDMTMTTGNINTTATNIITLTDEGTTTTVGNANSFVNGPMQYAMTTDSGTRSTLNFPVGKATDWRPVILQVAHTTNTSYTYRSEVFNASARALGYTLPITVDTVSDIHYWDVDRYLSSTMAKNTPTDLRIAVGDRPIITLYFGTNDVVYQGSNLTIVKNTAAAATTWFDIGGTSTAGPSSTPVAGTVVSTSSPTVFNSFSRFTLGSRLVGWNPLPIELVSFEGTCDNDAVNLSWMTASEINNDFFTIERSTNGYDFTSIGTVEGAGNSNQMLNYYFVDNVPMNKTAYYRLKQMDYDGEFEYSKIIAISCENTNASNFIVYPNPGLSELIIKSNGEFSTEQTFVIIDVQGQIIHQGTMSNEVTIQVSHYPSGIYLIRFDNGESIRWIKQ